MASKASETPNACLSAKLGGVGGGFNPSPLPQKGSVLPLELPLQKLGGMDGT